MMVMVTTIQDFRKKARCQWNRRSGLESELRPVLLNVMSESPHSARALSVEAVLVISQRGRRYLFDRVSSVNYRIDSISMRLPSRGIEYTGEGGIHTLLYEFDGATR